MLGWSCPGCGSYWAPTLDRCPQCGGGTFQVPPLTRDLLRYCDKTDDLNPLWSSALDECAEGHDLAAKVTLLISEYQHGDWSEDELREKLRALV